ncbi:bleomycin resistance protein [Nostocoides australiense]
MDRATPNLPTRDMDATVAFYAALGFDVGFRDEAWLVLYRGDLMLEFFPFPEVDPQTSSFSCCLRVDDLDALVAACEPVAPVADRGWPRLHLPTVESSGLRIGYLVDPDGTLLRLIHNS